MLLRSDLIASHIRRRTSVTGAARCIVQSDRPKITTALRRAALRTGFRFCQFPDPHRYL